MFECVSSGILFMSELTHGVIPGAECIELVDPCKKNSTVSVFEHLTAQQKEDLTSSAQHALRLVAFKKINHILALEASEADLLFSSTTSSDKLINKKKPVAEKKPDGEPKSAEVAETTVKMETSEAEPVTTAFDYEKSENFSENINNISMFILNNYASTIFDSCFSFLDLGNLKN